MNAFNLGRVDWSPLVRFWKILCLIYSFFCDWTLYRHLFMLFLCTYLFTCVCAYVFFCAFFSSTPSTFYLHFRLSHEDEDDFSRNASTTEWRLQTKDSHFLSCAKYAGPKYERLHNSQKGTTKLYLCIYITIGKRITKIIIFN